MNSNKLKIIFVSIGLITIISSVLSVIIYKSFCNLHQIIDWNAISAIANILMSFITMIGVFVAFQISIDERKTASRLDLFERRFEFYYFTNDAFIDYYLKRNTPKYGRNIDKLMTKYSFLIKKEDITAIRMLLEKIELKKEHNISNAIKLNEDDIEDELTMLMAIFYKYLNASFYDV